METLGNYLLQMACWLAGFWLVYFTVLRQETFFKLNRWFLLSGLIASLVMPLFPIHYAVEVAPKQPYDITALLNAKVIKSETPSFRINYWLVAYLFGTLFFIFRFFWQTFKLNQMKKRAEVVKHHSITVYKLEMDTAPFSFFQNIYVSKNLLGETETNTVIAHEKVHIDERHWADLLLLEVVRSLQWFNPLLIMYRKAIMQNHEYLADMGTLKHGVSARTYKAILANQMLGVPVLQIANGFTLFNPTKRILMMNKDKTQPIKRLKLLWALPIAAFIMVAFAEPDYVTAGTVNTETMVQGKTITIKGKVTDQKGESLPGTSIIIAQSTVGTLSNTDGNFELSGVKPDDEIVFSFVGYKSVRQKVQPKMDITMEKEIYEISIELSEMAPPPPPPPPTIKGINTGNKKALIVIDGIIQEKEFNDIETESIKSVDILKGEAATKIYGDKGKDGVILISTKDKNEVRIRSTTGDKKPIIIIDGKEMDADTDIKQIDPNLIESINVIKETEAINKYGSKAKDGVIEITLKKQSDEEVFVVVEDMPKYPGGHAALNNYIAQSIAGANMKEKGNVLIHFIVAKNGKVKDATVTKSASKKLDQKALEIINAMQPWSPGKQRGKAVEVEMSIELPF